MASFAVGFKSVDAVVVGRSEAKKHTQLLTRVNTKLLMKTIAMMIMMLMMVMAMMMRIQIMFVYCLESNHHVHDHDKGRTLIL